MVWTNLVILHGSRLRSLHAFRSLAELQDSDLHFVCIQELIGAEGGRYFQLNSEKNVYMHQLTTPVLTNSFKIKKKVYTNEKTQF